MGSGTVSVWGSGRQQKPGGSVHERRLESSMVPLRCPPAPTRPNPRAVPTARNRGLQQLSPEPREVSGPGRPAPGRPAHHGARAGPASRRCRPARPHSRHINPPARRSRPAHAEVTPGSRHGQGPPELSNQLPARAGRRSAESAPRRTAPASRLLARRLAACAEGSGAYRRARPPGPVATAPSGAARPACPGQGTAATPTT